jgi:predicted acetyltransferase
MDIEVREVGSDLFKEVDKTLAMAFGEDSDPAEWEAAQPIFHAGRTLGAFDGEALVGVAGDNDFGLTVPGGTVVASGVHTVGVLPTHRRRGIMRSLLQRQAEAAKDGGRPVAYLWASEGAIYQRVGYGTGTLSAAFQIDRAHTSFLRPPEPAGRMRLVDRTEALKVMPAVYERVRLTRPGMIDLNEVWWNYMLFHTEHHRKEGTQLFFAIHETAEGADGYVEYRVKERWTDTGPDYTLTVEDLVAATDEAYAALWRYCFEIDLVRHVKGIKRPVDEPLLFMLAEPRAFQLKIRDGAWLRITDLAEALRARSYSTEGRLVLEVSDDFCPWNEGRWSLEGGPDGATVGPARAEADLVLDASTLASAYLGTVPFSTLARAGRVTEAGTDALRRADAMFASERAPWCPHVF